MIISACLGGEKANELSKLNHGALTFALLEGLEGKLLLSRSENGRLREVFAAGCGCGFADAGATTSMARVRKIDRRVDESSAERGGDAVAGHVAGGYSAIGASRSARRANEPIW